MVANARSNWAFWNLIPCADQIICQTMFHVCLSTILTAEKHRLTPVSQYVRGTGNIKTRYLFLKANDREKSYKLRQKDFFKDNTELQWGQFYLWLRQTEFHHKNRKMPYLSRRRKPAPRQQDTATNTRIAGCRQVVLTFLFLKPFSLMHTEHTLWDPEYVQTLTVPSGVWRKQSEFLAPSHILCKSLSLLSGTTFLVALLFTPQPPPPQLYLDFK